MLHGKFTRHTVLSCKNVRRIILPTINYEIVKKYPLHDHWNDGIDNRTSHNKMESVRKIQSVKDLFVFLIKLRYRYYTPAGRTWHSAFILKRDTSVLCVLFRKNGVDLRHYDNYQGQISIKTDNVVHFSGGNVVRNHYNESENFIHVKIAKIASHFCAGTLRDELYTADGRSYRLNPNYQAIRERSRNTFRERQQRFLRQEFATRNSRTVLAKHFADSWRIIESDCEGFE